jgi:nucleotide-binding universal stress UspA family protein
MSTLRRTVIIALDGSSDARAALPVGRALAALEDATPHLVHVSLSGAPPAALPAQLQLDAAQIEGAVLEPLAGPPGEAILQAARDWHALAIVLCTHTALLHGQGVLGHVAAQVLQDAPCPVILVRPEHGTTLWTPQEILVPYDGTPSCAAACEPAVLLARRAEAALTILHVAADSSGSEEGTFPAPHYADQLQYEWPAWAHELLERFGAFHPQALPAAVKLLLGRGRPESEIVRLAAQRRLDLIALSWNGSLAPDRAAVLRSVIRDAPCPVMIFRAHPAHQPAHSAQAVRFPETRGPAIRPHQV